MNSAQQANPSHLQTSRRNGISITVAGNRAKGVDADEERDERTTIDLHDEPKIASQKR